MPWYKKSFEKIDAAQRSTKFSIAGLGNFATGALLYIRFTSLRSCMLVRDLTGSKYLLNAGNPLLKSSVR